MNVVAVIGYAMGAPRQTRLARMSGGKDVLSAAAVVVAMQGLMNVPFLFLTLP